jgi:hypothetical protein
MIELRPKITVRSIVACLGVLTAVFVIALVVASNVESSTLGSSPYIPATTITDRTSNSISQTSSTTTTTSSSVTAPKVTPANLTAARLIGAENYPVIITSSSTSNITSENISALNTAGDPSYFPPVIIHRPIQKISKPSLTGIIVPLYSPPSDGSWNELISVKNAHPLVPIIAIINPDSGPGAGQNDQWTDGINSLRNAGITVVGYVATGYGGDSLPAVESQIQSYSSWYKIDGIFFDEMANTNSSGNCPNGCTIQQYYQDLVSYSASVGYKLTIGNPGTYADHSLKGIMSVLVIYESEGDVSNATLQSSTADYNNRTSYGVIAIGVGWSSSQESAYSSYVGWIYMTDYCTGQSVSVCNPYAGLPSYFASLVSSLDG